MCGHKSNPNSNPLLALLWDSFQESLEEILVWQQMRTGKREQDKRTGHASPEVHWSRAGGKGAGSEKTAWVLAKRQAS